MKKMGVKSYWHDNVSRYLLAHRDDEVLVKPLKRLRSKAQKYSKFHILIIVEIESN